MIYGIINTCIGNCGRKRKVLWKNKNCSSRNRTWAIEEHQDEK